MKLWNFENGSSGELSKIGHHFRKQNDLKWMLSKMSINIKGASKFAFFNEKKSERFG